MNAVFAHFSSVMISLVGNSPKLKHFYLLWARIHTAECTISRLLRYWKLCKKKSCKKNSFRVIDATHITFRELKEEKYGMNEMHRGWICWKAQRFWQWTLQKFRFVFFFCSFHSLLLIAENPHLCVWQPGHLYCFNANRSQCVARTLSHTHTQAQTEHILLS